MPPTRLQALDSCSQFGSSAVKWSNVRPRRHHVEYLPNVTATSASFFHLHSGMIRANPLYALLAMPNMLKEAIGWKTQ